MNQRPAKYQTKIGAKDSGQMISAHDLVAFLTSSVETLEKRGEIEAATRFEIMRDYIKTDVIEFGKPFAFNHGISLGI